MNSSKVSIYQRFLDYSLIRSIWYSELIPKDFSPEFILDSIQFILENNTFHFVGDFYKQIKGTAVRTKMAPTYIILVMGYFEEILYQKVEKELNQKIREHLKYS